MKQLRTLLVASFMGFAVSMLAQAPANDNFANASTLSGINLATNGTTTSATKEVAEPNHAGNGGGHSVWYEWTAPQAGTVNINVTATYRDLLAVYTGSAVGSLANITSAASGFGGGNIGVSFTAVAGTSYKIAVDARNNAGNVGGPFTLTLQMPTVLFPFGSVWKYLDDGSDQGVAWRTNSFNDGTWVSGPAQLGYGDGDEATVVEDNGTPGYNVADTDRYITTYFRSTFSVLNPGAISALSARYRRDDGIVVYLNGVEAFRNNLAAGAVDYLTTAANAGDDGNTIFSTSISPALLRSGINVIAVEIHQDQPTSSDISFDLELSSVGGGNSLPSVAITSPTDGATLRPGTNITISVSATDSDGSVTNVAIYTDLTKLADLTSAPFSFVWSNVPQGNYTLTAVATDNAGATRASSPVNISVNTFTIVPVTLIPSNSIWRFLDTGTDQGSVWTGLAFDDTTWGSGPAQLGYGDGDEATILSYGPDAANKYITTYFRRLFAVADASAVSNLTLRLLRDDGAIVYVNGVELFRTNLPAGPVNYLTLAPIGADYPLDVVTGLPASALNTGNNVLAIEMHQNLGNSTDLSLDVELIANTIQGAPITNTIPPFVQSQTPAKSSTVSSLTSIQVAFNESVSGVNASDLLVNGIPASGLSGGGNSYIFTFSQPAFGPVNITWAGAHGIVDQGTPQLSFDGTAASNRWSYVLVDNIAPTVVSKTPAAGAILTNITSVNVVFSENVQGVNAADLLVNGSPATGLTVNSPLNYTFSFAQPSQGAVNISWAGAHGITDTSPSLNGFNAAGAGATWSYTLTAPATVLIPSNTVWRFIPGTNEASSPIQAWRALSFNDSSWSNSATPFYYGDPYTNTTTGVGTLLSDMQGLYQCIYMRGTFVIPSPAGVSNFIYRHQSDDGFVAWINGTEVLRYNMGTAPVDPPFQTAGIGTAQEAGGGGAPYISVTNTAGLASLVAGTNVIAIQAFNASLGASTDFGLNIQVEATVGNVDLTNIPPRIAAVVPTPGDIFSFTTLNVTFSEPVVNVDASDLLINGVPATGRIGSGSNYTFSFAQPAYGNVNITWAGAHGIVDFDAPPKPFDGTAPGSTFSFTLINPSAPTIFAKVPLAGATVSNLTSVGVVFSEPVSGVNAADLLVNGTAATGLSGSGSNYTFTFPQPAYGNVAISWAVNHGIRDTEPAQNAFDATRPGGTWQYTLEDHTPPVIATKTPPAGANVTNIVQLTVVFSENVQGVNAADLLVNGAPALNFGGSGSNYTFVFTRPNTSVVNINWAFNHGIADMAGNPFDATGAGATWQYFTPDNVPPAVASMNPPVGATVRNFTQLSVTFDEPVAGVNASDLLINNVPAQTVGGSAAGPYTFTFAQPATGAVQVVWAPGHGITDLASPPNNFAGVEWNFLLNPNAVFADKIVINEIMFQPPSKLTNDEWIELRNLDSAPINLNGWRITKGVEFTFPNVTIPAGGYLVVAANNAAFQAKYPGVTNFVGPWTDNLANNGQEIRLETALGELVNEVDYASEGDWATRVRGPLLSNHRGWIWSCPADGRGPSLELMNPAMPNSSGQNWRSSINTNGTPGVANSVARTNIAPLILDMAHFPSVPRSTDPVVVSATILDERASGLVVTLFYRDASTIIPPAFSTLTMFDDGAHNDGVAGDKVFAATVPAQTNHAIIEFYVQAVDLEGNTNSWPALAYDQNNVPGQFANALYQVDDAVYAFPQPLYKIIMTETERRERRVIETQDTQSNAEMNGSFISIDGTGTEVRYNIGLRERGAGSRGRVPANQRVNVPNDRRWKGQREFNLNTQYTESQYAGYLLSRKSGADSEFTRIVRVLINNTNNANAGSPQYGCYIYVEAPNSDMAEAHFPLDSAGNVYRCTRPNTDLSVLTPPTSQNYSNMGYLKVSNASENDYSDLTNLTYVLNVTPNSNYAAAVRAVVNVEQWMLYFAMNTMLSSEETTLGTGVGDDYGLYRGVIDPRFVVLAHDWDTILNEGDTRPNNPNQPIFRMAALPAISRFIHWPEFEPIYYATLRRLCQTTFAPAELGRTLDEGLGDFVPTATINAMKAFASNRVAFVLSQLPADTNASIATNFIGGTITSNTIFAAASSPYRITGTMTIPNGVTLTIQPGTTLQIANGANIVVANGGRILADGTSASPILFTRATGGTAWGNLNVNGAIGSPETRIANARFEFNVTSASTPCIQVTAGTVFLDYLTFANSASPYIHVDGASFLISHCEFPTITGSFEPVHGNGAVKAGGRGIFLRNWWGRTIGYNDSVDYTGGNRPGSPIVQFIENVFMGSDDDLLDIDGTDAWVEGNIFFRAHRNGSPDSSSAVSGGNDSGQTSEITIFNNIFFDVDQAYTAKQGNFYTFINNTVVHQTGAGFGDSNVAAVVNYADEGIALAAGGYNEGNIIFDIQRLTRNVTNATPLANAVTFNNNLMPVAWFGPGTNNSTSNPLFKHVPTVAETLNFTNWASAQIMREWLSLQSASPGSATGPNGGDKGAVVPLGARVSVQPGATANDAILLVGINRTGNSIPAAGFPNGSGYTHYKWRLDGGPWSAEIPSATPINIPGFHNGQHRVDVSGKRDSGMYQDDPQFLELASVTSVFSNPSQNIRLNEVFASNQSALNHEGTFPDALELYNANSFEVDISGLRLTDDLLNPDKFTFPAGTKIPASGFLTVYGNNPDGTSGIHIGFGLNKNGQTLALYESVDDGGLLIDSVTFGLQVTDFSIGRIGNGWTLCVPTFDAVNIEARSGDPKRLLINEILTSELTSFPDDFVEIYNPQSVPIAMGGLFFSDNPPHWPERSPVPPLTFIGANAYIAFRADGNTDSGAEHLSFALAAEQGLVALLNSDHSVIDCLIYGPQSTDVSQGRSPLNNNQNNLFTTPTPGAPNPGVISTNSGVVINEVLAANATIREPDGSAPDWIELYNLSASSVDIGDYSLSDSSLLPRQYVFAPGTIIPGNSYLRLRCNADNPASPTNTGFNIKAEGGAVYLFDKLANGGVLRNSVTYGLQAVDFSISRVPNGTGNWALTLPTPGGASIPASTASPASVRVNEWLPVPTSGEDWFELWNPNPQPVAIGGYYTTDDLNNRTKSPIPALSYLGASTNGYQRFWADSNPALGANHANFKLNNAGESIGFASPSGTLIDSITFSNQQVGVSEGRFPDGTSTFAKFPGTESPGDANYLLIPNVAINEALTHTDPPFEDAIELRNLTAFPVNIQNWWLSDAKGSLRKYRITNSVTIPANGYVVFYEYQFNNDPTNNPNAFSLSSANGDEIYLSIGDSSGNLTGYRTSVDFGAAQNGVSFGRYVTSDNRQEFVAMSTRSLGQDDPGDVAQFRLGTGLANPYPKVGPIVISQIMYHPPDNGTNDNTLDEFVELRNITGSSAPLYDPAFPTNTWRFRDGMDFDFPAGVSLPPNGKLLVVSFDPVLNPLQLSAFRSKYGVDGSVPIYGPYTGKLANGDDKVELYRPDNPDAGFVPYVLADRVHYFDVAPWTVFADGTGASLQRVSLAGFGNDPTNWVAALPNFGGAPDNDGDGIPNSWEMQYGLDQNNPADANLDPDADGMTNLQEYLSGTSPIDPNSRLKILTVDKLGVNSSRLTFVAVSNKTYTVLFKNTLNDPAWTRLVDVSGAPTNRLMTVDSIVPGTTRFYRLVTPLAP